MQTVVISDALKEQLPEFMLAVCQFKADVFRNEELSGYIKELEQSINLKYELKDVLTIPKIKAARDGYKTLGKDPSRYRLACESLLRRIVKGNPLYRINNVVDIGNILSIKTNRSVAVLDHDQIKGDVLIRIGTDEIYEGIGRGRINIEHIPTYSDEIGAFGTPTSDTPRTMITDDTNHILLFIISFNGKKDLEQDINLCFELYKQFANAKEFNYYIVE
ncbi:B3/B4 domain-containing protein [Haloplasma contractile]|uniref:Phosphoenolpyruvate synthase protein n=1 Tax=Haloplasma contractile SSD-17B TaxID=1033810 RepID=U2FQU9_9MOLU|nr:phenylalanine--tRNA ligase beta subunit-related protein [Haloplasma contractile]ERJ13389.1 Phosphoenolpyruvate synthase protein [Haloplasma contractile SSD-17B]